jgi:hypothetical protein
MIIKRAVLSFMTMGLLFFGHGKNAVCSPLPKLFEALEFRGRGKWPASLMSNDRQFALTHR